MVTQREWLAEQGLAKPGARGRFSKEAHEALAKAIESGMTFDDPVKPAKAAKPVKKVEQQTPKSGNAPVIPTPATLPKPKPPQVAVRNIGKQLTGYTPEGWAVGFAMCSACANHANYCRCPGGPVAPSLVSKLPDDSPARLDKRWR